MIINIEYFARFKEKSGKSKEIIDTNCLHIRDLYNEINKKYNFDIDEQLIKVAVNEEFVDWNTQLNNNDTVVFIQPVAGG